MESHIRIKATVPEMSDFFDQDDGVRYYEIRDKRYTQPQLDMMPEDVYNNTRFTFFCVYRHIELDKPLSGTFSIASLKKRLEQENGKDSVREKLKSTPPPVKSCKAKERDDKGDAGRS